jgi:hypothetical protein
MSSAAIIFPIFEECKNFILDPFWKEQFSNFSHNQFPHGMKYDQAHHNLILRTDKKTEIIALPGDNSGSFTEKDTIETFQILMKVLREKLNISSTRDLKVKEGEVEEALKKRALDINCEWKKIKPKYIKEQLVTTYIGTLKERYSLSLTEVRQLTSIVQIGFQFKAFSQDDVVYSNGIVTSIKGLKFDKKNRIFIIPQCPRVPTKAEKPSTANKMFSNIDKFLRDNTLRVTKFTAD